MKDNVIEVKRGIKLHLLQTNKFKTNLISVFLTTELNRESVTKNALIAAVLRRGTNKIKTQEEISKKLEEMYGAEFDCGVEKTGDNQVIKFYLESLNDKYLPEKEDLLKNSVDMLLEIVLNPLIENNKFNEEYVQTEKSNLKQLIESKIDNKDLYAFERTTEEMYKGKLYSLYKYGYVEDLEKTDSEELYSKYKELISNAKIDIFISGEFDENTLKEIVKSNENIVKLDEREPKYIVNKEETEQKEAVKEIKMLQDKMNVTQGKLVVGMQINEMKPNER